MLRKLSFCSASILLTIALMLLCVFSCSRRGAEKASVTGSVRLYTSVPLKTIENIKLEFERENPEIPVRVFRAGTGAIMDRIREESETGKVRTDLVWLADFSAAEELKEKGLLQQYVSPEVKDVIPIFTDDEGYYTGSRLLNIVVAFNSEYVREHPQSYQDMLKPEWKGKVGIVDPEVSGAAYYTVSTLLQSRHFRWWFFFRLYQNQCTIVRNNRIMAEKLANGEIYVGIIIDNSVREMLQEYPALPIDYVYPKDGIVAIASPIGITRDCGNVEGSRTFIDWILSKRGQGFMSSMGIGPVRADVEIPGGMMPLQQLRIIPSNAGRIYRNKENVVRIFRDIFSGKGIEYIDTGLFE